MSLQRAPSIRRSPAVISSSPAIMRSSVDLPQPDGPTKTTNSPSAMSRSTPLMISTEPNLLRSPSSRRPAMLVSLTGDVAQRADCSLECRELLESPPMRRRRFPRGMEDVGLAGHRRHGGRKVAEFTGGARPEHGRTEKYRLGLS